MAIISRQTGLLAAENWKKVYQTFRDADFTAYDFETLRKSMIDYIKLNYPEDFNDFTESSEFVALIDLIAYFGQSLAFRTDLNARENFIDTAERRDSVLKLARLLSYNPKRSISASGFLKIDSITTTESVFDSDGINLANSNIVWNDSANENWLEQFNTVVNACMVTSQSIGKPNARKTINGIRTEEYSVNVNPGVIPVYRFSSIVEGQRMNFEAVSATTYDQDYIYEQAPDISKVFNILYRNDGAGNSSNNTGFFLYFKQGELNSLDFSIQEMISNKVVNIDVANINNNDVWLYSVDSANANGELWTEVPSTNGINVIYNDKTDRNLYQITSRAGDQISLVFGDGSFANIPQGNFRVYYRTSNGLSYKITPDELRGILISFEYISRANRLETLTLRASLRYTVTNASARETIDQIKERAPQQYYTQNRMVTGEDYNILPYTTYSSIIKNKAINRTSIGLSRYLDILDTSGKYSSTNIFSQDGVLYANNYIKTTTFSFSNSIDVTKVINTKIQPIVAGREMMHYYYGNLAVSSGEPMMFQQLSVTTPVTPDKLINGERYTIQSVGTTNFTVFGAENNFANISFVASGAGVVTKDHTVANVGTSAFSFNGSAVGNNPTITARVGDTLTFTVTSPGNPFWIKSNLTTGPNGYVTTGNITNNGSTNAKITWNTAGVVPGTYYYVSQNQLAMSGNIVIESWGTGQASTKLKWVLGKLGDNGCNGYFSYNSVPEPLASLSTNASQYIRAGALCKFVAPPGYFFTGTTNLVAGVPTKDNENFVLYAAVTQVAGNGTNNGLGLYTNGSGPVSLNTKIPTGAILESVIPVYKNALPGDVVASIKDLILGYKTFALIYSSTRQYWLVLTNPVDPLWHLKFVYNNTTSLYEVFYRGLDFVFHSPIENNFFFDDDQNIYDPQTGQTVQDHIKILKNNSAPDIVQLLGPDPAMPYYYSVPLMRDYEWRIYKSIVSSDGYVDNKSIYLTYSDTNEDGIPDNPMIFQDVVAPKTNANAKLVFFQRTEGYDKFEGWRLIDSNLVISNIPSIITLEQTAANYDVGQLFYLPSVKEFRKVELVNGVKVISSQLTGQYKAFTGRQNLYYQYRHNSPETNRIDPSISNIIDLYVLTDDYNTNYRQWLLDITGQVTQPEAPTNTQLTLAYPELKELKSISDSIIFNSAVFKPVFGDKAVSSLQATFKVVKNPTLNITDSDVKTQVIAAINDYFAIENWDFGETFYFSELSAYLHKVLSPNIASIVIVPKDPTISFGNLYQINAEPNELIISAATVDDVEIITAVTASQLYSNLIISNVSA